MRANLFMSKENTISVPHYSCYFLFAYLSPIAKVSNKNGWCYNIYYVNNIFITTGYSYPRKSKIISDSLCKEYESKAIAINNSDILNKKYFVNGLVSEFLLKAI